MFRRRIAALGLLAASACGEGDPPITGRARGATVQGKVAEVDARFVSVAVDTAQVIGGKFWNPDGSVTGATGDFDVPEYDFSQPKLRNLMGALGPSILRVGGSDADLVYYDLSDSPGAPPEPYEQTFTRAQWDGMTDFAKDLGWGLLFTLNAGPGPRNAARTWTSTNARDLVRHAVSRGDPVEVWELGNEINAFQALHGPSFRISGAKYAEDLRIAKDMLTEEGATGRVAGPSSAFWPEVGEAFPVYPDLMRAQDGALEVVTWHYYPQQSRRCPLASRRAEPGLMRDPRALDEVDVWAEHVEALRDMHAPDVPVWLSETGNAQCGGEPGISDRFIGSFWWLDQLGQLAARGQPIVIRQNISGADYALLDDPTLEPRPDYWATLLFKRWMGPTVLGVQRGADRTVRTYAHCTPAARGLPAGAVTVMVVNVSEDEGVVLAVDGLDVDAMEAFRVEVDDLDGRFVRLGDDRLEVDGEGRAPELVGVEGSVSGEGLELRLRASSYGFFVLPDAAHPDCGG